MKVNFRNELILNKYFKINKMDNLLKNCEGNIFDFLLLIPSVVMVYSFIYGINYIPFREIPT